MSHKRVTGYGYDKFSEHADQTPLGKLQKQYWTTKQQMIQKLGKKEDEYVVMSDAELDAKLDLFEAIEQSSAELLKIIEMYQEKLINLSIEESEMSRLLKSQSTYDTKTKAGKMMAAVSKAQNFSSQQRTALRLPLVRLYNEVETFQNQAIRDTFITIRKMENCRTEYRGALLWMKNVSTELDPDTSKKLEKFRRVQAQVKKTKIKFDKFKNDVIQKIDLLSASRCNMFSHALVNYTQTLILFWQKTAKTMNTVADAFKGYQYYEFNIIKDLVEPSKKLAELCQKKETQNNEQKDIVENETKLIDTSEKVDEINELIDLITESESDVIKEQLKELEILELEKKEKLNQLQKEQTQKSPSNLLFSFMKSDKDLINLESSMKSSLKLTQFSDLLNTSSEQFEKEWESAFVNEDKKESPRIDNDNDEFGLFTSAFSSNSFNNNNNKESQEKKPNEDGKINNQKKTNWFDLFAELDPLKNPDTIGQKDGQDDERNC